MPRHIIDGVGALDLDRVELRIVNDEVLALFHLVAAAFVLGATGLRVSSSMSC
jgi:hypothetical protein